MTTALNRRWFAYSLRTLFMAVTVFGIGGFWVYRQVACNQARYEYDRTLAAWRSEMTTSKDLCEASLHLFHAESAVPFADRGKAAVEHLDRLEQVREIAYGPISEWMMGVTDDASLARAEADKAEIEGYCTAARRMAADLR